MRQRCGGFRWTGNGHSIPEVFHVALSWRRFAAFSDLCAALVVAAVGVLITLGEPAGAWGTGGMLLVAVPLLFRRVSVALASAGFVLVGVWLTGLLFGVEVRCGAQLTAMAYLAFWAGRTFDRGLVVRWWWLVPLFLWGEHRFDLVMAAGGLFLAVPMLAGSVGIGLAVRGVDRRARELDEASDLLRREQAHTAALAAAAERLRICERLQAVVDARLAEILELVRPVDGTTVRNRLAAVEDTAGAALERLRSMLLDLRAPAPANSPAAARPARPSPGVVPDRRWRWGWSGVTAIMLLCTVELTDLLLDPDSEGSLVPLPVGHRLSISLATAALLAAALVSRRWPVAAVALQAAVSLALVITGPEVDYLPTSCLLAIAVVTYRAGLRLPRRPAVAALVLLLLTWLVAEFGFGAGLPVAGYAILGPWLAGRVMRSSRRLVEQLEAVHARLEAERINQVALATQVERRHLLGEVHDVLGGALSVVLVQAAGAHRVTATDPDAALGAARTITDTVLHARGQVAVLRAGPQEPGRSDTVEDVVTRMRRAGMSIRVIGSAAGYLAGGAAFVLARVVQESLTNALRYAHGAEVTVELRRDGDDLTVAVTNGAAPPGAAVAGRGGGLGLTAMAERVAALGGVMTSGPADGGWAVRVQVPFAARPVVTAPA